MPKAKEPSASGSMAQVQQEAAAEGIENFELPRSVVMKLARASQVPENTKFSKDVILAILKASTVFINYLASKQHKSISATDVLKALELVEFGDIAKNIQGELQVYRDLQRADKKKGGKGKARDTAESVSAVSKPKPKAKAASAPEQQSEQQKQSIPPIHIRPPSGQPTTASPSDDVELDQHGRSEDVDEDQEMMDPEEEDGAEEVEEEDMDDDEDDEDEDGEPEDPMALEEEELRRDARDIDEED
ncbi:hypothetical protein BN946_scf185033.g17 [Trametes cinnabarina]|uniref:DNA polymerase epsilon subunit D n=1 Tax=Pycnoporus cinnabarinus TaxID=5643 RepID=A0A060SR53_PYCCI|nr:hypothetical protein BN946_scf185033.g17 [Trametes cinnabarina]